MAETISIITPWLDHPEFIADYERAVADSNTEVIVVDNASVEKNATALREMVARLGGKYVRNEQNRWFSAANNQGLEVATGQIILFLNNDISASPGWLDQVRRDVKPGMLAGPTLGTTNVEGRPVQSIEGWCIAGRKEVWEKLKGWDERAYSMPYWEDNDLCYRAESLGFGLQKADWPVTHKKNGTSGSMPGVQLGYDRNFEKFSARVLGRADQSESILGEQNLESAIALHSEGRLAEAESIYLSLIERDPKSVAALNAYYRLLIESNRLETAADVLKRAVNLQPDSLENLNNLGAVLGRLKRHAEAAGVFESAAARFPNSAPIFNNYAKALKEAGRHELAVKAATQAIAMSPKLVIAHVNLSHSLRELGRIDDAVQSAKNAIQIDNRSAAAHVALAMALQAKGDLAGTLDSLRAALTIAPTDRAASALYSQITQNSQQPPGLNSRP